VNLFLRRGWIVPLVLGLFVDNVRGTPIRAAAVLAALLWSLSLCAVTRRLPRLSFALPALLLWSFAGVIFSSYRANTLNEWALLVGAAALGSGFAVLLEEAPEEKDLLPWALMGGALAKSLIAWPGGLSFTANASLLAMFWSLALITGRPAGRSRAWFLWAALAASSLPLMIRWNASSALLGLAVGLPLSEAFRRSSRRFFLLSAVVGTALLLLLMAGPRFLRDNPDDPRRLNRLSMWRDSAAYAAREGLLGTGLGTFEQHYPQYKTQPDLETANFAHNEFLQAVAELGLPGTALVLFLLAGLVQALTIRGREAPGTAAGLTALFLWANLYYPFRSDALLFAGALLTAEMVRPSPGRWAPAAVGGAGAVALLAAAVCLGQGVSGFWELAGGRAWEKGETESALSHFQTAARWNPLEPRLLDHQVECLRRLGRKKETLLLLEDALALKPRDVWIRRKLAVARLNLVGPEAAIAAYRPLLDLAPNVPMFRREFEELAAKR
jgi:O-antigen ligase